MIEIDHIYNEDCLVGMKRIPDGSIDAVICDLPYGTTDCAWDSVIPLYLLWEQYLRILTPKGTAVLFAQQPFTSVLVSSNLHGYRHAQYWIKDKCSNFLAARYMPMKYVEDIIVFSKGSFAHNSTLKATYNPMMVHTDFARDASTHKPSSLDKCSSANVIRNRPCNKKTILQAYKKEDDTQFPKNYLYYPVPYAKDRIHPTQKPVDLLRYLILTYTNEGDTVLDNCMGSGTTAVAAIREKRHFIGFELNKEYYDASIRRIKAEQMQKTLFADVPKVGDMVLLSDTELRNEIKHQMEWTQRQK